MSGRAVVSTHSRRPSALGRGRFVHEATFAFPCQPNGINPLAYFAGVIARSAASHPQSQTAMQRDAYRACRRGAGGGAAAGPV